MSTLWRKALSDLGSERARAVSIVAALALGIAGFFAVLSAYAILTRALNDGYLATNPPSARLVIQHLDDEVVRTAASIPGVRQAEARRTSRGRVKAGPAHWKNLVLFARRDFATSRLGTVALESGAWPSGPGELAIERDALQVARLHVGDVTTVRGESGRERSMRVTGSVHDVGQAQARMENLVYGYVTLETLATLGEEPYYDELAIRVAERQLDESHVRVVANAVKTVLETSGHRVLRIDIPEPGQHPHAKIMGLLMLSLAVFGACALVLSGILVFNVMTALLAGQVRQIGVMKALGGTRLQIASIYLLEAGLLGAAAIATALPIGLFGGRRLCRSLAMFLNFDIATFAVPGWIYALVLVVGIAVPIIAAILPVWLGTRVTVREALTPNGPIGRTYGTSVVDRALARVGGPSRVLLLAIRNVTRNRLRVVLTLVTLSAGGVFFMSALNVRKSLVDTVDRFYQASRSDLAVSLGADYAADAVERAARKTPGVSAAEGWIVVGGGLAGEDLEQRRNKLTLVGLPAGSSMMVSDTMLGEGTPAGPRDVVVNTALFDRLNRPRLRTDVRVWVEGHEGMLRVTGVVREPFSPSTAYVSRAYFDERSRAGTVNSIRVALESSSPAALDAAKTDLEALLEREGIRVIQASTKADSRYSFDQHMLMIYVFLVAVSFILGAVGGLGLLTTVSLNVTERRRELGVLRAIGATPARIAQLVVIEGALVGALAWLIATVTVVPLTTVLGDLILRRLLRSGAEVVVALESKGLAIWLAVAIVGSALASYWPARQSTRMSTREALTFE